MTDLFALSAGTDNGILGDSRCGIRSAQGRLLTHDIGEDLELTTFNSQRQFQMLLRRDL